MLLSQSLAMTFERVARLAIGFAYIIVAARYLEPDAFGLIVFSQTIILLLNSLAGFGIEAQLPQMLMRRQDKRNVLLVALIPRISFGLGAVCIVLLGVLALSPPETTTLAIMTPMLLFGALGIYERLLITSLKQNRVALIRLTGGVVFFILKCAVLVVTRDVRWVAVAIMLESATLFFVTRWFAMRTIGSEHGPLPQARTIKELLQRSLPLSVAISTLMLFTYTDQMLLRWFHDPTAVGEYALAARFTEAWVSVVAAFALAMTPEIIRDHDASRGRASNARLFRFLMEIAVCGSILFMLLCWLLVPLALPYLVGEKLEGAAAIAQIYSLIAPLAAMRLVSGKWFVAQNMNRALAQRAIAGLVINLVIGVLLIPRLGGIGAATSTVVAYLFVGLFADLLHPASRSMVAVKLTALLPRNTLRYVARWRAEDR